MLNDDEAASDKQARQIATGQYLALSNAVHALIATHPFPSAFAAAFEKLSSMTHQLLLTSSALQNDDGLRQSYAEIRASLLGAVPES